MLLHVFWERSEHVQRERYASDESVSIVAHRRICYKSFRSSKAARSFKECFPQARTPHGPRHVKVIIHQPLPQQVDRNVGKSPGGHAEGSEDLADALRKKLKL